MATVKCEYTTYYCGADSFIGGEEFCHKNGYNCSYGPTRSGDLDICAYLENKPCFIEKECKSIHFDGEFLKIGNKLIAGVEESVEPIYFPGKAEIDMLEIDGKLFVKDGQYCIEKG